MTKPVTWVAVDWGSSNLRAWRMEGDEVTNEAEAPAGAISLDPPAFEPALLEVISPWLTDGIVTDILVCGMAGARGGWQEAAYAAVPCPPVPSDFAQVRTRDPRLSVHILPGLSQDSPADVLRGEETQLAGLLATEPRFDGVACLPGTHTKWVRLSAGEVVSFASYMTGELFSLLATRSVLRKTVGGDGWSAPDFIEAVDETLSRPEGMAARLFRLRAEALLHDLPPERARARLSGLLVGAELAGARPYWLGADVVIIGADHLAQAYRAALAHAGLSARLLDATAMTQRGLAAARAALLRTRQ